MGNPDPIVSAAQKLSAVRRGYWIDGPAGAKDELKSWSMELDDYLELVWKVERSAPSSAVAIQWLRRLYYSTPLKGAGGNFDNILKTDLSRLGAPVTTRDVPQSILDLLVRVKNLCIPWEQRPENQLIDISHVLVLLDYRLNGANDNYRRLNKAPLLKNNVGSMLSWAADLASVWLEFNQTRRVEKPDETREFSSDAHQWFNAALKKRASRNDLLGDFDGVILFHQELPKSKTPISDLLATYYQQGHSTETESRVADRFALFCTRATPVIPYSIDSSEKVSLTSTSKEELKKIIEEAATFLLAVSVKKPKTGVMKAITGLGSLGEVEDEYLTSRWSSEAMNLLVDNFFEFLSKELDNKFYTWPTDSFDKVNYSGYQGTIEFDSKGFPLLDDLEAIAQYFLNWKTPNKELRMKDRLLMPLRLTDPQGAEAVLVEGAHPGTTRIRVERFVRLDEITPAPLNEDIHADLLYLEADMNPDRQSKKYKIIMINQEDSTITILGLPVLNGPSRWKIVRCPRIVLIDPWGGRIGGDVATLVDGSDRPAVKLDLPSFIENGILSEITSNFDTIRLFSDTPLSFSKRQSQMYLITGVDPVQPIVYLDEKPSLLGSKSRWQIPVGALDEILPSHYPMTPQDVGCDHYDGRAFVVFDGKVQSAIRCSSYTSTVWNLKSATKEEEAFRSSVTGNGILYFQSSLSLNAFRNFSLMIYDSVDSTGKPIDQVHDAQFFFKNVSANRQTPPGDDKPFGDRDWDGKTQIRFHYGLPKGIKTGSAGCLVSPEYYDLRSMLVQLYNDQRAALGLEVNGEIAGIGSSSTHTASEMLWQNKQSAGLPDRWSGRLRGLLVLVRPSQREIIS